MVDGAARLGASRVHVHGVAAIWLISPAAMCDLPPFLTQPNRKDDLLAVSLIRAVAGNLPQAFTHLAFDEACHPVHQALGEADSLGQ